MSGIGLEIGRYIDPFVCGGIGQGEGGSDITHQRLQSCGQAIVVLAGR